MSISSEGTRVDVRIPKGSRLLSKSTIAVVGGTGRMGKVLVTMFQPTGAKIVVCSRNPSRAKALFRRLGVQTRLVDDVQDADVVVVSVPIERTVTTCKRLLKRMRPRSLLVDVSSVKKGIVDEISPSVPDNVEYLSLHPLFGPDTENFKGENVLAVGKKVGPLSASILNFLSKSGLKTTFVTIEEHDRGTAVTQALHHFSYMSLVACMTKLMKERDIQKFSTRSLRKTIDLVRSFSENVETIMDIQARNPHAASVRKKFAEAVSTLVRMDDRTIRRIASRMKMFRNL